MQVWYYHVCWYTPLLFKMYLQDYLANFQQEEELNAQLNVYAINYSATYGGYNDVKTQIGFDRIDKGKLW